MARGTSYRVLGDVMGVMELRAPPPGPRALTLPLLLDGRVLREVTGHLYTPAPPTDVWPVAGIVVAADRLRVGLVCYGTPPAIWDRLGVVLLEKPFPSLSGAYTGSFYFVRDQESFRRATDPLSTVEDVLESAGYDERKIAARILRDPNA